MLAVFKTGAAYLPIQPSFPVGRIQDIVKNSKTKFIIYDKEYEYIIYHIQNNPPKIQDKDDITGEPLVQRYDDKKETILKRLDVYHSQTKPLVDYYSKWAASENKELRYIKINGLGDVKDIQKTIFDQIN